MKGDTYVQFYDESFLLCGLHGYGSPLFHTQDADAEPGNRKSDPTRNILVRR